MCLQAQHTGRQPTPTPQVGAGWDPAAWSGPSQSPIYGSGLGGLNWLSSPSSASGFNLSNYLMESSTRPTIGQRSTPSAAAGSAAQLQDAGEISDSACDDVTEHEHERDQ